MFLNQFNYSILGSNTQNRVVFIHGLMAFSANWRKIASRIQDQYQCLIYDQRGHGRSVKPKTGYSPEIYANDLNQITDELGWDQFHLVGHSMGGRNSMVFADLFPNKLRSLVIEDMSPESDPVSVSYYEKMLNLIPTPFQNKDEMKNYFKNKFETEFQSKEPISVLSSFLQANIETVTEGPNVGLYDWRFSKNAILETVKEGHTKDRWSEIKNLQIPTLLIRGENSHIFKKEVYDAMLLSNSRIQGVEIKQAGHWIHYEKYEEFTSILREFLGKN